MDHQPPLSPQHSVQSFLDLRRMDAKEASRHREDSELRECTFRPNLHLSQSTYRCYRPLGGLEIEKPTSRGPLLEGGGADPNHSALSSVSSCRKSRLLEEMNRNLTFQPKVNDISADMVGQ